MKQWKLGVYILGALVFLAMCGHWGFDETANIVNNLSYPAMVIAFVEFIDHKFTRDKMHKLIEELHAHHIGRADDTDKP